MIEVQGLSKRYGPHWALRDISFSVARGEVVGVLGPNGAGKTTTLRILTGFLAPTAGVIRIDGIDALAHPLEVRKRMGYMPEGFPLYPEMRVVEYLTYRAELKGVPRKRIPSHLDRALELAEISDSKTRIIGQLSKGYRQRVGLADALVADPPLLILDEPTAGLDPNQIRHVRSLLKNFAGKKTLLLSTHILAEVEASCDRVVVIHKGNVAGSGVPGELLTAKMKSRTVVVIARGGEELIRSTLLSVQGVFEVVEAIELEPTVFQFRIQTEASERVLEELFRHISSSGFALRELRKEKESLEDAFSELTEVTEATS